MIRWADRGMIAAMDDVLVERVFEQLERDEPEAALRLVEQAVRDEPENHRALALKARVLAALERGEEALRCYERALRIASDDGLVWFERGVLLERMGREEEAAHSYEKATECDPDDADAWLNLGRILDDAGGCEAALACYEQALEREPSEEITWSNRGNSLLHLHRYEEALASYDRALEIEADSEAALLGKSHALVALGRIEEANASRPGEPVDPGEWREVLRRVGEQTVVVPYSIGRHRAPELLDRLAVSLADTCVGLADAAPGLADGTTIAWGWSQLTVRARGTDLVLHEPSFLRYPLAETTCGVSFTLQHAVMALILADIVDAELSECRWDDTLDVAPGAIDGRWVQMHRQAPAREGRSGWRLELTDSDGNVARTTSADVGVDIVPTAALVAARPHLLKVVHLPPGYTVRYDGHDVVSVLDDEGDERFRERSG